MSAKDYQEAIDFLLNKNRPIDFEKVVVELAKKHPKIFLSIVKQERNVFAVLNKESWMSYARQRLVDGQKVEAIKEIRSATGFGLKEAKDIADLALTIMFPAQGFTATAAFAMSQDQIDIANKIAA